MVTSDIGTVRMGRRRSSGILASLQPGPGDRSSFLVALIKHEHALSKHRPGVRRELVVTLRNEQIAADKQGATRWW